MSLRVTPAVAAALLVAAAPLAAQSWRTLSTSRQLQGERSLAVNVTYAVGRLTIAPGDPGTLYRMDLRYDEDRFAPVREFDATDGTLRLGVRSLARERGRAARVSDRGRDKGEEPSTLGVSLTPDIPLDLSVEAGAAAAVVDLTGLALRSLRFRTGASDSRLTFDRPNTQACDSLRVEAGAASFHASGLANANCRLVRVAGGVGEVVLDFGGTGRQSMEAQVRVAFGELTLRIPRDVGVAIRLNRFLASFEQAGFVKRGDVYFSTNYATARQRLQLDVSAAFGGITVVRTGN